MAKFNIPRSGDGVGGMDKFQTRKLPKFEVAKLGDTYRLSFIWWPLMFADYKGQMTVDMFVEAVAEFREASNKFRAEGVKTDALEYFSAPQVVSRYQAYDKTPNGAKYLVARTEAEVDNLSKVFDTLGIARPEFKERIVTYVVKWPITSNKLAVTWSSILEDDDYEPEILRLDMTKNINSQIATLMQAGHSFAENDLIVKATTNKWSYNPSVMPGSAFFQIADSLHKSPQSEKAPKFRALLQKILDVVADHTEGKKSAVDVIIDEMGKPYTPEALRAKLTGAAVAAGVSGGGYGGGAPGAASGAVPDPVEALPDIDVDSILGGIS